MSEYVWKNISWKPEYNQYWSFASAGTMETTAFQNLRKCFQEVFGLDVSFNGNYFEANVNSSGIPVIFAKGEACSQISISGLYPNGALKMRKAGSDNTGIQERVADENGVVVLTVGMGSNDGGQDVYYYFGEIAIGNPFPAYYAKNNTSLTVVEENRYTDYRKTNEYQAKIYDKLNSNYYYASLSHFLIGDKFGWGGWFYKTPGTSSSFRIGDSATTSEQKPERLNGTDKTCYVSDAFVPKIPTVVFTNFNSHVSACQYKYRDNQLEILHDNKTWIFLLDDDDEVILYKQPSATLDNPSPNVLCSAYDSKNLEGQYDGGSVTHAYNGYITRQVSLNKPTSYILPTNSSFTALDSVQAEETSDYDITNICSAEDFLWNKPKSSGNKQVARSTQHSEVRVSYEVGYSFQISNIYRFDQLYFLGSDDINVHSLTHNSIIGIGGYAYYKVNWAKSAKMYGLDGYWPHTPNSGSTSIEESFPKAYHLIIRDGFSGTSPNGWFTYSSNAPLTFSIISVKVKLTRTPWGIVNESGDIVFAPFGINAKGPYKTITVNVSQIRDGKENDISAIDFTQPVSSPSIGWIKDLPKNSTIQTLVSSSNTNTKWYMLPGRFWTTEVGETRGPWNYLPPYGEKPLNGDKEISYIAYNGKNDISSSNGYGLVIYSKNRKLPHKKYNNKIYQQIAHQHQKLITSDQRNNDWLIDGTQDGWLDLGSLKKFGNNFSLLLVYTDSSGNETYYEWQQSVDPRTATHAQAMSSVVYRGVGMNDSCASWGGLYRFDNSNKAHDSASLRMARPDQHTHWFGAIGATQFWNNGIPALPGVSNWDSSGWSGPIDLYYRVA